MKNPRILFIQRRPTRAGAQTSLFRLATVSPHSTLTLCHQSGWLTSALSETLVADWPSARSIWGRMGGLSHAAIRLCKKIQPSLIVANDHQECPFAYAIAKQLAVPFVAILRTPRMSQRDFTKYQCDAANHLFVVGDELKKKVGEWTSVATSLFQEGFLENEFAPQKQLSRSFPKKMLIAGSSEPRKGFLDFLNALKKLEDQQPNLPIENITLTGDFPKTGIPQLRSKLEFVGRVDNFIEFARQFDFAVHPSRSETFGLAPLELIIAGIPTLCTQTGCATTPLLPSTWLAQPASPDALKQSLNAWIENWDKNAQELPKVIENIRRQYSITSTSSEFFSVVSKLMG